MHVTAPSDWVVIGNAPAVEPVVGRRRDLALGLRPHSPAVDLLRHPGGRALPRDPRRARRHPAGPQRPAQPRRGARQGRRRDPHRHQAVVRRAAPAVRHPLPVRRLPPGVRARVQRRRDGEPGLRDLPGPARLLQPGHPGQAHRPRAPRSPTRWRTSGSATSSPRPGGTTSGSTSRSPSTSATGSPPTPRSSTTPGPTWSTRAGSGGWSPTRVRAPTRSPATAPSTRPRRCRTSTGSPTPRARASSSSSTRRWATRCSSTASSTT